MSNVYLDFKNGSKHAHTIYNNFITHICQLYGVKNATYVLIKQYILDNYNGVYEIQISKKNHLQKHYIRFSDPRDLTAFILRFS